MKQYEIRKNENISLFLTQMQNNVKAGHYVLLVLEKETLIGKITYIGYDAIYVDKKKINLKNILVIKRLSKKEYERAIL